MIEDTPETAVGDLAPSPILRAGQPVVFIDRRRRELHDVLQPERHTNVRGDRLAHDDVIGQPDGCKVVSPRGRIYRCFAATLVQHALYMKRHATIIYPKDLAPILMWADIAPGQTVVEGGFGSGAMSMALLRALGPTGRLFTYELREASANTARKNVEALFGGPVPQHTVHIGDIYDGIKEREVDRIVLDVPEPWDVVEHAANALRDGGILCAYVPTTLQLQKFALAVRKHPGFATTECLEILLRSWHVTLESVRPDQQMVGHTGFIAFSRRAAHPNRDAIPAPGEADEEQTAAPAEDATEEPSGPEDP